MQIAFDVATGDDFETIRRDRAFDTAADDHVSGLDGAVDAAFGADHDRGLGADITMELAVDMQSVA